MNRDFNVWLSGFRNSIADYGYYVDFDKVYKHVNGVKVELSMMNSLVGSKDIETDFVNLAAKYPSVLKCIPLLLAVRANEIVCQDEDGQHVFYFSPKMFEINDKSAMDYIVFMRKTGLFDLLENHIISNLVDYATGVEVGLDSNGRKNRGGHLMENLVEGFIVKSGFVKGADYYKEMYIHEIYDKWHLDMSKISNQGKMEKRFDFVVRTDSTVYGIEANFYASGGSKLNETSRSYKTIALESRDIDGFEFVWFTDGAGWRSARHNLEETFDVMRNLYSIKDLESGIMNKIFE